MIVKTSYRLSYEHKVKGIIEARPFAQNACILLNTLLLLVCQVCDVLIWSHLPAQRFEPSGWRRAWWTTHSAVSGSDGGDFQLLL